MPQPSDIIDFWFAEKNKPLWFVKNSKFDKKIRYKFLKTYEQAYAGYLDSWKNSALGILALIIVFDQFSRNMFRGEAKAFMTDGIALNLAKYALEVGYDKELSNDDYKHFIYMPFMHSEDINDQEQSLILFNKMDDTFIYAQKHYEIIKKFGRFPHRNKALNRNSTLEELELLTNNNINFFVLEF